MSMYIYKHQMPESNVSKEKLSIKEMIHRGFVKLSLFVVNKTFLPIYMPQECNWEPNLKQFIILNVLVNSKQMTSLLLDQVSVSIF